MHLSLLNRECAEAHERRNIELSAMHLPLLNRECAEAHKRRNIELSALCQGRLDAQKGWIYMLDKIEIGKRIAFYRRERNITQKDLADYLHISYQAVSKWELGKSLPTIEMLYEISNLLNVTVDMLLNEKGWKNRCITYRETGLDSQKLHALKEQIMELNSNDDCILSADYADACLFRIDTTQMREPVYSCVTCVPGSKESLAKDCGYNREICADAAANAMNYLLQHGTRPVILKAMAVCGSYDQDQLYLMAQAFQQLCEQNGVSFAGMEIAAQPGNYGPGEYKVSATAIGVQDREKLLTGNRLREGDILIGMKTEGIEGTCFPFVKIMLEKNPELYRAKIDQDRFLLDELMKPNIAFTREIAALQEAGYLRKAFRIGNALLNGRSWRGMPEGLGACIDLETLPIMPLYRFLFDQERIGENVFSYHFNMGIGMVAAVPEAHWRDAMEVVGKFSECWRIGRVESDRHKDVKVWSKGQIRWRE